MQTKEDQLKKLQKKRKIIVYNIFNNIYSTFCSEVLEGD
jgi:hypothetical protein